jgi:glycosyltransferase involved in cell wall biosynthesis
MTPLVTIVITSFNYAPYVGKAIESALAQTYENLEILVLDNASTDESANVIGAYTDPRIRFIQNESNIGLWPNQNKGIRLATGEYVLFLSADDYLLPRHVEDVLIYLHEHPAVDIVYSPYIMVDKAGKILRRFDHPGFHGLEQYEGRNELASLLTQDSYMCFPTALFRRGYFEEFGLLDETFSSGADFEFFIRLAFCGKRFGFTSRPSVCVRVHENNISGPDRYIKSGQQVREYTTILSRYVIPESFGSLTGYRNGLSRMVQHKVLAMAQGYPDEFTAQRAELEALAEQTLRQIAMVPQAGGAQPLISVIVPSTGDLASLVEALDSIAAQSYEHWEAVVVLDGAYDATRYLETLPYAGNVRLARTERRLGTACARNAGIHLSRGEVVAYLDEDNRFLPGYLLEAASAFADPDVRVTVARADLIVGDSYAGSYGAGPPSPVAPSIALNAITHRRCCVDEAQYFNENLTVLEDWEFLLRYSQRYVFTPLLHCGAEVRVRSDLKGHELFGRRSQNEWNDVAAVLTDIYKAYPGSGEEVKAARDLYVRNLTSILNVALNEPPGRENAVRVVAAITCAQSERVVTA